MGIAQRMKHATEADTKRRGNRDAQHSCVVVCPCRSAITHVDYDAAGREALLEQPPGQEAATSFQQRQLQAKTASSRWSRIARANEPKLKAGSWKLEAGFTLRSSCKATRFPAAIHMVSTEENVRNASIHCILTRAVETQAKKSVMVSLVLPRCESGPVSVVCGSVPELNRERNFRLLPTI
jgi:hypothetical protein